MKVKLFFFLTLFSGIYVHSQFTTGTVSLPTTGMTIKLDTNPTTVTLTLTGSSTSWLGVGFNATGMGSLPDTFIYNSSGNRDYKINGYTTPSADAAQDWSVTTNSVSGGIRTIVATRSLAGGAGDYVFTNSAGTLNIIYAMGAGTLSLSQHNLRDVETLAFSTLGVDDVTKIKESFKILQNPVRDNLDFDISVGFKSVKIYDISGKQVKIFNDKEKSLNISDLKSGVYFLEINSDENGNFFEKFVKQ